jgi:hypothetical protein
VVYRTAVPRKEGIIAWVTIHSIAVQIEEIFQAKSEAYNRAVRRKAEFRAKSYQLCLKKSAEDFGVWGIVRLEFTTWHCKE